VLRHEEEARPGKVWRTLGFLRGRKRVRVDRIGHWLPANAEQMITERVAVHDGDGGRIETLPDGSLSIPLYEEELVVTKRIVLRERVIVRKETVTRLKLVQAELRREHIDIDTDSNDDVDVIDER
jgi:uncharacterized protein (TIGR02271 family)